MTSTKALLRWIGTVPFSPAMNSTDDHGTDRASGVVRGTFCGRTAAVIHVVLVAADDDAPVPVAVVPVRWR